MYYGFDPSIGWIKISERDYRWHLADAQAHPDQYDGWRFAEVSNPS